jgi:hypothetical protein
MNDGMTREAVKADILDRLVRDGWVKLDGDTLRLNSDTDLDQRERTVVKQMISGTEPTRRKR